MLYALWFSSLRISAYISLMVPIVKRRGNMVRVFRQKSSGDEACGQLCHCSDDVTGRWMGTRRCDQTSVPVWQAASIPENKMSDTHDTTVPPYIYAAKTSLMDNSLSLLLIIFPVKENLSPSLYLSASLHPITENIAFLS